MMMMSPSDYGPHGSATAAFRVGADLRAARQRLGWDLAEVAAGLRIRASYLEAIEEGRLSELPGNAYAVGFLRTYAHSLGLDPDEISRRFRAEAGEVNRKTELAFPAPVPERGVPAGALALLGVVLAIGAYVGWYRFSGDAQHPAETVATIPDRLVPLAGPASTPSPQVASVLPSTMPAHVPLGAATATQGAASAAGAGTSGAGTSGAAATSPYAIPAVSPSQAAAATPPRLPPMPAASSQPPGAPPGAAGGTAQSATATAAPGAAPGTPPAPGDSRIVLRARADAWMQVREKQGHVLLNRVLRAGETWPVPATPANLLLTTGNAGGTELLVDGVPAPALGNNGVVRRDLPLDPDAIRDGKLAAQPVSAAAPAGTPPARSVSQ
jgi:cytoskeleton protein RodZ